MSAFQRSVLNTATLVVLFAYVWRTMTAAGVGAVAGVGTIVGVMGGAVMGGFVGYEICKEHQRHLLEEISISDK